MKIINEIYIESELEQVWRHTIDVESWARWNPIMKSITRQDQGEFGVDSAATIDQVGMKPSLWRVQTIQSPKHFSWSTKIAGMTILATHNLSSRDGQVRNELILEVSGLMGLLLWPILKSKMQNAIVQENQNFKKYCEANHTK